MIKYFFAGVTGVIRGCSVSSILSDECVEVSTTDVKGTSCVCQSDYCNDGQAVKPTLYNVVFGIAMATFAAIQWMKQI